MSGIHRVEIGEAPPDADEGHQHAGEVRSTSLRRPRASARDMKIERCRGIALLNSEPDEEMERIELVGMY